MLDYHDLYARLTWSFYFLKAQEDEATLSEQEHPPSTGKRKKKASPSKHAEKRQKVLL